MLNELRELSISLKKAGINPPDYHSKFTKCPKRVACWIYLDDDGNVSGSSSIPIEQVQTVRKWEGVGSNGISFPALNMPPLYKVADVDNRKKLATMKRHKDANLEVIRKIVSEASNLWSDNLSKKSNAFAKIDECLDKSVNDLIAKLAGAPPEYSSINILLERASKINSINLHRQLSDRFLIAISEGNSWFIDMLFYYGVEKPSDFQLIFEINDWKQFPANHVEVQKWMNSKLLSSSTSIVTAELDAYGCNAAGKDEKFPDVGFKNALGNVKLRAMTKDSLCQTRYGMIEHGSFPTGKDVRKEMKRALEWLGDDNHKGKTWCDLSRRMDRPMLLFAYPSQIPDNLPDLAGMIGDSIDEITETEQVQFASLAEKVITSLRGRENETVDSEIRLFVLAKRKGDARTKVVTSNRYSYDHVIRSAQLWQEGCKNIPVINIKRYGKNKGDKPIWTKPLIPFPAEAVWCLNTIWEHQGTTAKKARGDDSKKEGSQRAQTTQAFSVNDGICLLLGEGFELQQVSSRALGSVIRNSSSLLLSLGQTNTKGFVHKTEKKYEKQALLMPTILGLLLNKLNIPKGEIMESPAFLVGRLMNLADSLHLEYCRQARKNSIPPQLVGNALMATALETPERALSLLSQRILPYQAWARTLAGGDEVKLTKWFIRTIGEVTDHLKDKPIPKQCNDADKAQMLLGYLARTESGDK